MKKRACPVCGHDIYLSLRQKGGSYIYAREFKDDALAPKAVRCCECKAVYLNPIMTDEEYSHFYNEDGQKNFVGKLVQEDYQTKISTDDRKRAKLIKRLIRYPGKLLDVGTGYSNFVGLIDGAVGIDISKPRVDNAKKRGLDVRLYDIFEWNEKVDTITLFHVLEHIPNPKPFLNRIYNLLNGHLVIEVPNLNDALVGLEKYQSFYYQNAHCSYFTPTSLRRLLNSEGFVVKKEIGLQRYSLDNHLQWLFKGKPGKINAFGFLNPVYSTILKTLRRHDTIFLICNKE